MTLYYEDVQKRFHADILIFFAISHTTVPSFRRIINFLLQKIWT